MKAYLIKQSVIEETSEAIALITVVIRVISEAFKTILVIPDNRT